MRNKLGVGVLVAAVAFLLATNPLVADAAKQITGKQIKNNSVASKDIKNNSVKGGDIKDGSVSTADVSDASLKAVDFAPGELPFTRAFQTTVPGPIAVGTGASVTVATLNLAQAGTYVLTSKVYLNNNDAADSFVQCTLSDGVVSDATSTGIQADAGEDDHRTIGALIASTTAGPATVTFSCLRFAGGAVAATDIKIVAVKVTGLN
jgi:hypothetical protein